MLTQQRNLNVVANNLVNVSTAGFKESRYTATTFDQEVYRRVGNKIKDEYVNIGTQSYIRANSQVYTIFDQGVPEPTNLPLDFAIQGDGFFAVSQDGGETAYTRMGSFSLDEEGYLCLPGQGRVLDVNGQPLQLNTDKVVGDSNGRIYTEDGGQYLGQLGVYTFDDLEALTYNDQGLFTGGEGRAEENPKVLWGYLERANVDMTQQMTEMLTCQRALQSAAQAAKMYDNTMTKITTEIGRL
jgi:flagellar basal-body rod protein FlgG